MRRARALWRWDIAFAIVAIALALALPRVIYSALALRIVLWALFAVSVDLLLGFGGMLSFGHAAFWGGAGYTAALLAKAFQLPFPLAAAAGVVA
ncbi:MAG: branched-chain amino acid ABC transporter permease, partial [Chloroflexota bacterium]|nr:branched-chain amino acid ABC transporter permease [Chloroflexota bacterium]